MITQTTVQTMKVEEIRARLKQIDFMRYSPFSTGLLACELQEEKLLTDELEARGLSL